MKYIDDIRIKGILEDRADPDSEQIKAAITKSLDLKRLTLEETACLLNARREEDIMRILEAASLVKERIYGGRVVLFAPLYVSNVCLNNCFYCAFRTDNTSMERRRLSPEEIGRDTELLLRSGHKRILIVSAESLDDPSREAEYLVECIRAVYSQEYKGNRIRRVNINCAPLSEDGFRKIKEEGIGTYQLFQETYHEETYRKVHPSGPKSDPDERLGAVDRAYRSGLDDIGIGVLYGIYDHKFDTLALLSHVEHLEKTFGIGPHTISVPRIEPASGTDFDETTPYKVNDDDFRKLVAVLRLSVPYTGLILSTREAPAMRDELLRLGISQVSAASSTVPGGYSSSGDHAVAGQFALNDHRSLDDVVSTIIDKGGIPSFCTACYRKERTGGAFMDLARPGTIKGKCSVNALITLKEYLDDFASPEVRKKGYALIEKMRGAPGDKETKELEKLLKHVEEGVRDEHV